MKKFILKDVEKNTELLLPITPASFEVSYGTNYEVINMHIIGDIAIGGNRALQEIKINCMLPSKRYPFNHAGTDLNPYNYTKKFEDWSSNKTLLRFVISKTTVNRQVKIKSITYGEKDGSNDVYCTIVLQEYHTLKQYQNIQSTGNNSRSLDRVLRSTSHIVKKGDTLSSIARKYYGNANKYIQLASYNNIKNPHLIKIGQIIKIPDKL